MENIESFEDFINESYNKNFSENLKESTNDYVEEIGDLEELIYDQGDMKTTAKWDDESEDILQDRDTWSELEEPELVHAIDMARAFMKKHKIKESADDEVNEAKKIKPFNKVKVGDKAEDYHGDVYNVIAKGKMKDLKKYDDSGTAGDFLEPDEDVIALDLEGETAVFTYGDDGAVVYD